MSQEKSPIDKQIREKLLGMEVAPSDALWSGIEQSLLKQKRAALILYWRIGAAAAILLFALAIPFFLFPNRQVQKTKESLAKQNSSDSILRQKDSTKVNKELPLQEIQLANDIRKQAIIPSESKQTSSQNNANISLQKQCVKIEPEFVFMDTISYVEIIPASIAELPFSKTVHPLEIEYSTNNLKEIRLIKSATYKQLLKYDEFAKRIADQQNKNQEHAWALGLAFSPTSVGRFSGISLNNYDALYSDANGSMPNLQIEKDLPAYAGGVNVVYQLSDRWSLQSGLYYLKQGQSINNFSVVSNVAASSNNTNSFYGNIALDNIAIINESGSMLDFSQLTDNIAYSIYDAALVQRFELLEIPLMASYKIINKKIVFSLSAGINQGFLIGNQVYFKENTSQVVGKTEDMNTIIYKSVFGISFDYPLARRIYFNFSPTLKYQLTNFNKNAIVGEDLRYFELKTGISYRF